jgi:hypothetical protein
VQVDSLLATSVAEGAAVRLAAAGLPVVVAPTVWCGLSEHHMPLGGTFTLDLATYHALLRGLCQGCYLRGAGATWTPWPAWQFHRIPTHGPTCHWIRMGSNGSCLLSAPLVDLEISPQASASRSCAMASGASSS